MTQALFEWPSNVEPVSRRRDTGASGRNVYDQYYPIPGVGDCVRVTSFLKVVGTGSEFKINWAATEERKATIEAAMYVASKSRITGASKEFADAIEARCGPAKRHLKIMNAKADIGTAIHERIKWDMCGLTGQKRVLGQPDLSPEATIGYLAFKSWWQQAGYTAVRAEQNVYHRKLKTAGRLDLFAMNAVQELGILDWKSSKWVYDIHHLQLKAYWLCALDCGIPVTWAKLVHLPTTVEQVNKGGDLVTVHELGEMYDRNLTHLELEESVHDALRLWRRLCEKREG